VGSSLHFLKDSHAKHFQKKLSGKGSHIALLPTIVGQVFGFVNNHHFQILSYLRITDLLVLSFSFGKIKENQNQIIPRLWVGGNAIISFQKPWSSRFLASSIFSMSDCHLPFVGCSFFMAEIIIALEYLHCLGMALVLSITLLSAFIEFYEPSQQCRILMHLGTECGVIFAS
jgi:hypothetical protein